MMNNVKKTYNAIADPRPVAAEKPKGPHVSNTPGKDVGQMRGNAQMDKFGEVMIGQTLLRQIRTSA